MRPWHGIVVANTLPLNDDLSINFDRLQEHIAFLAANGVDGACPNGSLGEYQVLTVDERKQVLRAVLEAAPEGFSVIAGVGAYGSAESLRWAEDAREAGAHAVLALPPNSYRANDDEVVDHYREVARAGLPIVAYNNPYDTRIDITADLFARLAEIEEVVAVKEFSGDIRRITAIQRTAPRLDVLAGADDVVVEAALMGAVGWIGGFSNSIPQACAALWSLAREGKLAEVRELYAKLQAALTWDTKHNFVQAIKVSQEVVGRYAGPCRPPRSPLSAEDRAQVIKDVELALTAVPAAA
ncbi:dihydrodipicolinate synthase family protein [Amycolatopsis acidicola]|uniref:Dihydrodipicolinate synthase family protein n=1 Tax=Amycolatopsis acidicola TaxID=2596893 RepID=A0A5N0VCB5_9PSEU|nr:dihydrodipicolinate synthase family protein [Amycolatopsis acidicola]KAA9164019.1 dihydrodipicolinate synthase family protein [Amycolatopsis acidicola]